MSKSKRYWATGAAAAATLVLSAGVALASVSGTAVPSTNGTAGYGVTAAGTTSYSNVQTVETPNQYGTTVGGGVLGVQLSTTPVVATGVCNVAQAGEVPNVLTSTYAVQYGLGSDGSLADPCPVGGAIPVADRHMFAGLTAVANTDTVWVSVSSGDKCTVRRGHRGHWSYSNRGCYRGNNRGNTLTFAAQDLTTNSAVVTATLADHDSPVDVWTGAAVGVQESTNTYTDCAVVVRAVTDAVTSPVAFQDATCQPIVAFNYATDTLKNAHAPVAINAGAANEAFADAVTGANSATDPAVVSPENSLTTVNAGVTGPATSGASAVGDHFVVSTANAGS